MIASPAVLKESQTAVSLLVGIIIVWHIVECINIGLTAAAYVYIHQQCKHLWFQQLHTGRLSIQTMGWCKIKVILHIANVISIIL